MPLKTPMTYLRHRRDVIRAQKPTAHAKLNALPYINPQSSSPLFNQIPGEIRHLIYEYALLAYPDPTRPYSKHSYHYRPGYTHARAINTNLLLSCRRVYLEAGHLAVSQNEHLIYQPVDHGPPGHRSYLLPRAKAAKGARKQGGLMKNEQRRMVQQVHIFAQQCWLEGWTMQWWDYCYSWLHVGEGADKEESAKMRSNHPPRLKITIRHTDWWYYLLGRHSPLALDAKRVGRAWPGVWVEEDADFEKGSWGGQFRHLSGLKVFELELETLLEKRSDLDSVIERARKWRFLLADGDVLVCNEKLTTTMTWTGSRHFKGPPGSSDRRTSHPELRQDSRRSSHSGHQAESNESPVFNRGVPEISPEDCFDYIVVTLTWLAQPGQKMMADLGATNTGDQIEDTEERNSTISTGPLTPIDESPLSPPVPAAPAPIPAAAPAPQQGIFAHNIARAPRRDAIPTYYG